MRLPATFGKYELLELLGGGMAKVYRGRDTVIGRTVAVKILNESADSEAKARFLREAQTAGNIVHENIIHIYDFGEEQGRPYMVMEFLRGQDLRQAIQNQNTGDIGERLRIATGIARALEHIHSLGVVHRDIKPDNIHIDTEGKVRLMDFGIAKTADLNLTRPGYTLGTPSYMAPEQVRGEPVTPLVDVYAFGILLFELLCGAKPIQGASIVELFQKILQQPVDLAPLEQARVSRPLIDLVRRSVSKQPSERPQSLREVREFLEDVLQASGGSIFAVWLARLRRFASERRWFLPAVASGLLLLLVILIFALRSGPEQPVTQTQPVIGPPEGMVLIPAGSFPFGDPPQQVALPSYFIDRTEVSNAEYAKFAKATGRPVPARPAEEPVARISIDDARAYAQWAGKRLPTSEEWEKAARGASGRLYPWGDQHEPKNANVADNPSMKQPRPLPVTSMPESESQYGVLHLVGNVAEFVLNFQPPTPEQVQRFALLLSPAPTAAESWCLVRGGAFDKALPQKATLDSALVPVRYTSPSIGFRCVKEIR